jgi:hypothetical protein
MRGLFAISRKNLVATAALDRNYNVTSTAASGGLSHISIHKHETFTMTKG